ncbi:hypothetical protein NFI96_015534, partial [Prochilodus magdalenae]
FDYSADYSQEKKTAVLQCLLDLSAAAARCVTPAGVFTKLLTPLCSYSTFPFGGKDGDCVKQCGFLLDLYSHVKTYETQSGRSVLPALQPVYQSVPAAWIINLSEGKSSLLLEVLKLRTVKKPVELRGWSDEESEVRSFLQCLPYISQLRMCKGISNPACFQMLLHLLTKAAECEIQTGEKMLEMLTSVCTYSSFPYGETCRYEQCDFLLDLYSHVKNYESQTGRGVLPVLQPFYQSAPAVWSINLSERKSSLLLEVLKQTGKKPIELRGWSDEESEVRSFLQCLPYISQLRFKHYDDDELKIDVLRFLQDLFSKAAECDPATKQSFTELLISMYSERAFPFDEKNSQTENVYGASPHLQMVQCEFLLDLYSHVKDYESQTGRSVLPALQPVYQSAPAVWIIKLSERKSSLLLEVLKLQTEKKPVELRGWSDEESEMWSFLPCLPYISQLRFGDPVRGNYLKAKECLLKLGLAAVKSNEASVESFAELLASMYSKRDFPFNEKDEGQSRCEFLLDLYSHVKNYESQTDRSLLLALQPVYQLAPAVWIIDLLERKSSLLLEVLKLQTEKKPVELRGWSDEESEVRSFLQSLPYMSQLRFCYSDLGENQKQSAFKFLLNLGVAAAESDTATGETFTELLTSVCSYTTFPFDEDRVEYDPNHQWNFVLDFCSFLKNYETQSGRSVLSALLPVYQSAPAFCDIDLSEGKSSLFLEVLKLQPEKKPVELWGWPDEESEVRSFLQCLPYISQLRFKDFQDDGLKIDVLEFLQDLCSKAAECDPATKQSFTELLISMCSERAFPFDEKNSHTEDDVYGAQCDFLLDLYSHVKNYETQTALQPVYQFEVDPDGYGNEISALKFLLNLSSKAAECDTATKQSFIELLISMCSERAFPFNENDYDTEDDVYGVQSEFLLDLYSHVKDYESQTGRSVLPALQPVYQSVPVWNINLSERKSSLLLEVLKLQTEKKPVELKGWSDEESEVRSFLQCLPYISQLRLCFSSDSSKNILDLFSKAAECEIQTGEKTLELLTSVCTYSSFPYGDTCSSEQSDFLLDLYSHVKDYEFPTGRSVLPALQPVYQSAPAVWIIDLSERKSSLFLEVLKLQTVKKPVELWGWSDEESDVRSFLQCLPYISQLRLSLESYIRKNIQIFLDLFSKATECGTQTGEKTLELLTSVCTYSSFPYGETHRSEQCDFLLDLYSHVKNYETQSGRSVLPAFQTVYQSAPAVWIINLSERKSSLLLEVLKLQTVKKPVKLRGWSDEESDVRSFLQCLPYLSQLRCFLWSNIKTNVQMFLDLFSKAAECEIQTGGKTIKLLTSVCTYSSFPYGSTHSSEQCDFLLDLYSHVKDYETQTGRSVLPAFQPVYQSAPAVWIINLSERKSSLLLEVLKLQTEKKPVELRGWSDEESEVRSFLQCLPYISQLSGAEKCVPSLCKVIHSSGETEQMVPLLQVLDSTLSLEGKLSTSICRAVGRVLGLSAFSLNLTLNPQAISLRGTRRLFRSITHLHTLRLSGVMVMRLVKALRAVRAPVPVTIEELSLIQNTTQQSKKELSRVLSSLASLLRLWNVQCLNMTEHTMEVQSLTVLLCHQSSLTIRLSKETLQKLAVVVSEAQDEELTARFLQKVGGDLTSCSLNWEMIHYFLKYHTVTVDFRRSNIKQQNIRELVSVLDRVQLTRLTSSFVLPIIREIYETGSAHCVSSLLSSINNFINLNARELDTVHCAALRFILQHCTAVTLSLLWTSIPEGELESTVPLLNHISHLSVDRLLLLRLLHCCNAFDPQEGAATLLLSALQHRLDFSCSSALDLTEHTQTHTLSSEDCRVISMTIQRASTQIQLILQDCEIEESGLEQLFTILHKVTLHCSKALLLQFLSHVHVGTELESVRRAVALSKALGEEVDFSQTQLDLQACRSLALVLEHSEGLSELDLSHCQLTDHCLEVLLPHLHKTQILDLSHNNITDVSAKRIYDIVSTNSNIQTVRMALETVYSAKTLNKLENVPSPGLSLNLRFVDEAFSPGISDLSASLLTEDHFRCPVCTDVLKEPVYIPCGHSYCKPCIQNYWAKPTLENSYSCPQCRKSFKTRPALNPNPDLAKVVQTLQQAGFSPAYPAHCYAGSGDVACDFCTGRKLRAVKSCLTCSASYCETHVKQHYTVAALQRHKLVEVTEDLEQILCKLHHRALEVFCKTDQTFICLVCAVEEHKEHETELAKIEESSNEVNAACGVNVRDGGERDTDDLSRPHYSLQGLAIRYSAVPKPGSDAAAQDALDGSSVEMSINPAVSKISQAQLYNGGQCEYGLSVGIPFNLFGDSKMVKEMKQLLKDNRELTVRAERAEKELDYLTECRRLEYANDFIEVAALGRPLELGMLYDCHSESFSPDAFLWDDYTLSSMRISLPRPHMDMKIVEGKSLQERLKALDLTTALTASVVSGLVEVTGAAAFLKHPTQSQLQDRVTVHYRTSTRLDLLSHRLLHKGALPLTNQNSATHVVVAVLYGSQAFLVLDDKNESSEERAKLKDKNLDQTSACVVGSIKEDMLNNAVDVLEHLERNTNICQDMMSIYGNLGQYQSDFQRELASCIKTIREKGEKGEMDLQALLQRNLQSPFSPQNMHHWLLNKDAKVVALKECSAANITIVKSQEDLKRLVEDSQADRVLCFTLTSLEAEESSICLYQLGNIVRLKVNLELKPELLHLSNIKQTCVTMRLQRPESCGAHWYRVDYRAVNWKVGSRIYLKWSDIDICNTEESVVVTGLTPDTQYQLRYAIMDSTSMSDYSRITEFQTLPRARPGQPKVLKQKKNSLTVSWLRAEADEDSPVRRYMVEYKEAGLEGWQSVLTEGPECEYTITLPYSTCYRVRVSAVYKEGDTSKLSEETEVSLDVFISAKKTLIFIFTTVTRVEKGTLAQQALAITIFIFDLKLAHDPSLYSVGCMNTIFFPTEYEYKLSLGSDISKNIQIILDLFSSTANCEIEMGEKTLELLTSVCTYSSFPYGTSRRSEQSTFLLDLYSQVKNYKTQAGRSVLPALQPVYQSAPAVWIINLSERKSSLLLEVLKLQTVKKPVELRGWSDKESDVRSFLQCLPYISQLRFGGAVYNTDAMKFLLKLSAAAAECDTAAVESFTELLVSMYSDRELPFGETDEEDEDYDQALCDFLLDLYSHVKNYDTQTDRRVLPALQPVYQSAPAVWIIDLSERKSALLLEVLKLQTVKKPVELRGWSDEESEVRSFLQCLPYISQLRLSFGSDISENIQIILDLFRTAAVCETETRELLTSLYTYSSFPYGDTYRSEQSRFLLDLYSHVKNYESQTGRSVLPALQPVYQSAPAVWNINLSKRKSSLLLDVLKLHTVKKPVELRGWSDEESDVRSFLQCLPYISQLRLSFQSNIRKNIQIFLDLFSKAAECETQTGEKTLELLTSVCTYSSFPYGETHRSEQCEFLLDLYSHMKNNETQTGRSVLPALQPVYQSAPAVWIIDLSERKSSLLLEVLKLQTVKKRVKLRGWSDEESDVRSFLQCLPHISQLRCVLWSNNKTNVQMFLDLFSKAAECEIQTGEKTLELLTSVCTYSAFPYGDTCSSEQCDFLLDLYSHVKNYETQTGRRVLPALQPVYQSAPAVWIIDLSERKSSLLLEVLKLQTEKKPVELRGWSDEESDVRSFLQCLPYISQLSGAEKCVPSLCKVIHSSGETEQITPLLQVLDSTLSLEGKLSTSICRAVGRVLGLSASSLNLTLNPKAISLRGTRRLFRNITHLHTLRLSGVMVMRMVKALRAVRAPVPVTIEELSLIQNTTQRSKKGLSRVLSSLASLLRLCNVQCLNMTEHTMEVQSLTVLLCHKSSLTIRLSKEILQKLAVVVSEAQDEELTACFLQKVGGDLTSCSLNWKMIYYFLQYHTVTVDFRRSNIKQQNIRELVSVLDRVQLTRLTSSFVLPIIREIYETGSAHCVSSLLSSIKNCINLNSRELDSVHCAALRFILQHCTAVSLSLLWTSIPEGELESTVPLLNHVSHLSVDRLLLLRLLHCCSASDPQEGAATLLLSALQHRLDFSCSSALDLTEHTQTHTLSSDDCRVISMTIQRASTQTQLILQDCEIEESGLEQLFTILHKVTLHCSKALLLQFLSHVHVGTELESVRRAVALSKALGEEVDLSQTELDLQACRSLALVLEHSEGLSELDLSHCQVTDHCLELLLPHLHKTQILE